MPRGRELVYGCQRDPWPNDTREVQASGGAVTGPPTDDRAGRFAARFDGLFCTGFFATFVTAFLVAFFVTFLVAFLVAFLAGYLAGFFAAAAAPSASRAPLRVDFFATRGAGGSCEPT